MNGKLKDVEGSGRDLILR